MPKVNTDKLTPERVAELKAIARRALAATDDAAVERMLREVPEETLPDGDEPEVEIVTGQRPGCPRGDATK